MSEVTRLLTALKGGDSTAAGRPFDLVYEDLRRLASARMDPERADHTLQATALVHEVLLAEGEIAAPDRARFLEALARAMRRILVEHARRRSRLRRGGGRARQELRESDRVAPDGACVALPRDRRTREASRARGRRQQVDPEELFEIDSPQDPDFSSLRARGEIPPSLHSEYHGGPFRACSICEQPVIEADAYEIQKVHRSSECVFEMAVCYPCARRLFEQYSEESRRVLLRMARTGFGASPEEGRCDLCCVAPGDTDEYTSIAVCRGHSLLSCVHLLCDPCADAMQSRLSRATRDTFEGFLRDHFPGVPAGLDLPVSSLV